MKRQVVFLDRDGVLNRAIPDGDHSRPPWKLEEFELLPGVPEAIGRLREAGFALVVVTNQPDVARGKLPREMVDAVNRRLCELLPLLDVFVCCHDSGDACSCRKPKPGMLLEAALKWDLDLETGFLIGDRWSDVAAAQAAGCKGILIDTPYSQPERCTPDFQTSEIGAAVEWILKVRNAELGVRS